MRIRRLGWSGLEIEQGGETVLIDYILDTSQLPLRDGQQLFPSAAKPASAVAAVVTHLHPDHADPVALDAALRKGAPVFRPEPAVGSGPDLELTAYAEASFRRARLDVHVVEPWTSHGVGPFKFHAVPAADGFGDPQVSCRSITAPSTSRPDTSRPTTLWAGFASLGADSASTSRSASRENIWS